MAEALILVHVYNVSICIYMYVSDQTSKYSLISEFSSKVHNHITALATYYRFANRLVNKK